MNMEVSAACAWFLMDDGGDGGRRKGKENKMKLSRILATARGSGGLICKGL